MICDCVSQRKSHCAAKTDHELTIILLVAPNNKQAAYKMN